MPAAEVDSVDALLSADARALDDDDLRRLLRRLMRARARVDAAVVAATVELDQRDAYVADGMVDAKAWIAHHTGVARRTAGALVWLAKRARYMSAFAQALSKGAISFDHVRMMAAAINPRTLEPFTRD